MDMLNTIHSLPVESSADICQNKTKMGFFGGGCFLKVEMRLQFNVTSPEVIRSDEELLAVAGDLSASCPRAHIHTRHKNTIAATGDDITFSR